MAARVTVERDKAGHWWVVGRISPSGVLRVHGECEAQFIVDAVEAAYKAGREDALQAMRELLNVPKRLEGQD